MLIKVMYADGRTKMVPQQELETLIEAGSITKFMRGGDWADIDHDLLRRQSTPEYVDDERFDSSLHH